MQLREAYSILGILRSASKQDIKKAYRNLVLKHHPDRGGDPKEFIKVQAAYEILMERSDINFKEDFDILVPSDLREIIDDIVRTFKERQEQAEHIIGQSFEVFEAELVRYIKKAKRGELRRFNSKFVPLWNDLIQSLFTKFNNDCAEINQKYETWFESKMKEVFNEIKEKEEKAYYRSIRFYIYFGAWSLVGLIFLPYPNIRVSNIIVLCMGSIFLSILSWMIDAESESRVV